MGGESSEMLPFDIFVYTDPQQLVYFLLFTLYSGAEERTTFKVIDPVFFWLDLLSTLLFMPDSWIWESGPDARRLIADPLIIPFC